jgi:hypothetical protein
MAIPSAEYLRAHPARSAQGSSTPAKLRVKGRASGDAAQEKISDILNGRRACAS